VHGITISKLETEMAFGSSTIRKWAASAPSVNKLKKVADYFGVTVDELLKDETKQKGE
jgi:transcriptional regulator with XRE-family HTH domain